MAADFVIFNSDQKINQANGLSEAKTESKK